MEPYSESDWDVLRVVRDHLSEAYKVARAV